MRNWLMVLVLVMTAWLSATPVWAEEELAMPNFFQYRVGLFRPTWRTEWLLHRVIAGRDTLGDQLLATDVQQLIMRADLPETSRVELQIWSVQVSVDRHGRTTRIRLRREPNVDRLAALDRRDRNKPFRPQPAPLPSIYQPPRSRFLQATSIFGR